MRAYILEQHGTTESAPLQRTTLPTPRPKGNQIRIKVSVCGLCHTDLDTVEGRLQPDGLPVTPGHQIVGTVDALGPQASKHRIGDRIGVTWLNWACRQCEHCREGRENLCAQARWTGLTAPGGYAEYTLVHEAFAYPIPTSFSDTEAAPLLCAGVIGYRTVHLADIANGQTIGLFGFGASAHIVIQILKAQYPDSPICVFTRGDHHRKLAHDLGAGWTGSPADTPPTPIDRAMDFTPVGETIPQALALLAPGGRLVINAIRKQTPVPPLDYVTHLWHERHILSVANVTRRDALEFLPLAERIGIRPQVETFAFDQLNDALLRLKQGEVQGAAVLRIGESPA